LEIKLYEKYFEPLKDFLSLIKGGQEATRKNVNYTDSSAIYIKGKEIEETQKIWT